MKTLILFCTLLLGLNVGAHEAAGKGGGNGQLTVIPRGETKPVPYEAVRAWETGKYLNFFRLPNINRNIEPREKFNKMYGVYALEWLEDIKSLSPKLHTDLMKAARNTMFRIVNDYITWEHKAYPQGQVDYKSYEKAAFYNGEIILSTPVMDRVGPLNENLTAEQNQGFIVVHELINAAYPDLTVAQKLDIGQAIIRAKIFNEGETDFNYHLGTVQAYFISLLKSEADFMSVMDELIHYAKESEIANLKTIQKVAKLYAYTNRNLAEVFAVEASNLKFKADVDVKVKVESVMQLLNSTYKILKSIGFELNNPLIDLKALKTISSKLGIDLYSLLTIQDPVTGQDFQDEGIKELNSYVRNEYEKSSDRILREGIQTTQEYMIYHYREMLLGVGKDRTFDVLETGLKKIQDTNHLGISKVASMVAKEILAADLDNIRRNILAVYKKVLCENGVCIDESRTINFYKWYQSLSDPVINVVSFPFRDNDRFILDSVVHNVLNSNSRKQMITVNRVGEKIRFSVQARPLGRIRSMSFIRGLVFLK